MTFVMSTVSSGVTASGLNIGGDEALAVLSGGTAVSAVVTSGSVETISAGGVTSGTVVSSGGVLSVGGTSASPGVARATVIAGGTMMVGSAGAASAGITFTGTGGVLAVDGGTVAATISGFAATDEIDAPNLPYDQSDSLSYDSASGVLAVGYGAGAGSVEAQFVLAGSYTSGNFILAPDSGSGTLVTPLPGGATDGGEGVRAVFSEQVSSGLAIIQGEALNVLSGGTALDTDLNTQQFGGQVTVFSGGLAISTNVATGGEVTILSGGTATDDSLDPGGGGETVYGTAINTTASYVDDQEVYGVASGTFLGGATQFVEWGGTSVGTTVFGNQEYYGFNNASSAEAVETGGLAVGAVLISGTEYDGGTAIGTIASASSFLDVDGGGTAINAVIYSGSFETISAGALASGTVLSTGGVLSAAGTSASPAVAIATVIAGGTMMLGSYGAASGITFTGTGGVLDISGGETVATAISGFAPTDEIDLATLPYTSPGAASFDSATGVLTVTGGGSSVSLQFSGDDAAGALAVPPDLGSGTVVTIDQSITVSSGVVSSGLVIDRYETLNVLSGGEIVGTTVNDGGVVHLSAGASGIGTVLNQQGSETVFSGAVTIGTVLSGGTEAVYGTAFSTLVGGAETVFSGGVTSGSLLANGQEAVSSGGRAVATIAGGSGAGSLTVLSGGTTTGAAVVISGTEVLAGGASVATVVRSGGTEIIGSGSYVYDGPTAIGSETMIDGGTVVVDGDGTLSGGVAFIGSSGFLAVSSFAVPTVVSGFGPTDTIDIGGLVVRNPTSITLDSATDVVTVSAAGQFPYTVPLAGDYASAVFGLVVSGQIEGTGLTVETNSSVTNSAPCFARGTRIATEHGPVAVERLAIGDRVMTAERETEPVTWIGRRRIDCRRHPEPSRILPVLIAAHAFGRGAPSRDLLLSPDHAVFAEGVLIPVKHLIGGNAIRQIRLPAVTYFHIELHRHAVIFAEGLAVESYLDTGDRSAFDTADGPAILYPAFGSERGDITLVMDALGYAPLRIAGPEVEAVRAQLEGSAARLRHAAS